jgi:hypothetical protein
MYTEKNYRTKKELIADVKNGVEVFTYQPGGMFPGKTDGNVCLEGPHYPEPHKWYASAVIKDKKVIKVK